MDDGRVVLDAETKVGERPTDHKDELRLWLRLLTCTTMIEALIRTRLRERFGVTLPRFDLMAQLDKAPQKALGGEAGGMTLGALSRRMMVSNGNVTGLVERLVADGFVERTPHPTDRRAMLVRLTRAGRRNFRAMAAAHEAWVADAFAGVPAGEVHELMRLLAQLKLSVRGVG